ncbi:MAG: hypothetical protein ACLUOI_33760 [Eisenbergiella sp.]
MTSKKANLEDVFIELTEGESGVERSGDREEQDIPAVADETGNAENSGSDSAESEGTDE